jgi:NAD(P)-dependent dehydrogenase (short-subunit alcohol dehydrogenase family)
MQAKRFLVTGGSQGIGAALVRLARASGHQVVFTGRKAPLIAQVAAETGAHGIRAVVSNGADNA